MILPQTWRIAQVVPIYKKRSPSNPGYYRPISTSDTTHDVLKWSTMVDDHELKFHYLAHKKVRYKNKIK
jgi:hypothetical protein